MGTFQECSKDLHALLEILADCKHESNGFSQGDGGDSEREEHLPLRAKERAEYCWGQALVRDELPICEHSESQRVTDLFQT